MLDCTLKISHTVYVRRICTVIIWGCLPTAPNLKVQGTPVQKHKENKQSCFWLTTRKIERYEDDVFHAQVCGVTERANSLTVRSCDIKKLHTRYCLVCMPCLCISFDDHMNHTYNTGE